MAGRIQGQVFGEVADDFDRVRLEYPAVLVDDVLAYRTPDSGPALEIGAGTGKATRVFAARGVPVVAIEPDPAMAAILARHVPSAQIVRTTFEEYRPEAPAGLLYSGDAWHWTAPETRWQLAERALVPGGTLALFWNHDRIDDAAKEQGMLDALAEIAPAIRVNAERVSAEAGQLWSEWPGDELAAREEFTDLDARIHEWRITFSGTDYLTYMSTRSQIRMLAEPVRDRLFTALREVFGAEVPVAVQTLLYLARRPAAR